MSSPIAPFLPEYLLIVVRCQCFLRYPITRRMTTWLNKQNGAKKKQLCTIATQCATRVSCLDVIDWPDRRIEKDLRRGGVLVIWFPWTMGGHQFKIPPELKKKRSKIAQNQLFYKTARLKGRWISTRPRTSLRSWQHWNLRFLQDSYTPIRGSVLQQGYALSSPAYVVSLLQKGKKECVVVSASRSLNHKTA